MAAMTLFRDVCEIIKENQQFRIVVTTRNKYVNKMKW